MSKPIVTLDELFTRYGTDKGKDYWNYTPAYEKYLEPRRRDVTRVLEVGICGYRTLPNNVVGASLFAWRDYFPNADIYGIDNDGRFIFNDKPRIHTALCDAYNVVQLSRSLAQFGGTFDFIVDDALHDPISQTQLLNDLWPLLRPDGVYAMEDVYPPHLPDNDLDRMICHFPVGATIEAFPVHSDTQLLMITR
jgi:SAM-dependent methyltransferase